jgi:tRNA pseudouridine55 synthase
MKAPEASAEKTGLLLLNKSPGLTSFESLYLVKKALATPKVGHTGTLDKFASGLLLILVGRAVKLNPWFSGCDKHYEAVIRFGVETDTLDGEGTPIAQGEVPSREALEAAAALFRGELLQAPPAYSAVHIGGERAYKLARSGRAVEMRRRPVTIHALELRSYDPPLASIRVHCSAGTYIRSLARDIALAAGSRGHLTALNRTQVAGFRLAGALDHPRLPAGTPPDFFEQSGGAAAFVRALRPIDRVVFEALGLPCLSVDPPTAARMARGTPPDSLIREDAVGPGTEEAEKGNQAAGVFCNGELVGVIEKKPRAGGGTGWRYGYVYARP